MKSITTQAAEKVYAHSKKAFGIFTLALLLYTSFLILNQNAEAQPFAYVANQISHDVSVINTATNMIVGPPIPVGTTSRGVAITPDGTSAYVANQGSNNVTVIDTATKYGSWPAHSGWD